MSKNKSGISLIRMVKHGDIKVFERDKLGRCPLLVAIDSDMDVNVIRTLCEECNCDPRTCDVNGDTALHYAVNMDNDEVA